LTAKYKASSSTVFCYCIVEYQLYCTQSIIEQKFQQTKYEKFQPDGSKQTCFYLRFLKICQKTHFTIGKTLRSFDAKGNLRPTGSNNDYDKCLKMQIEK